MSATIGTGFLSTTDRKNDGLDTFDSFDPELGKGQTIPAANDELKRRRCAQRPVDWFKPNDGKKAPTLNEQIAARVCDEHVEGALSLVICNTVQAAQEVFRSLANDGTPKILLTSRFRGCDRQAAEATLTKFEARRRKAASGRIDNDPGLICVSTQVVEAGIDISAHRLWSELAPWPSMIQRFGRLNRDGRDHEAEAYAWDLPTAERKTLMRKQDGENWIGAYREQALKDAKSLVDALIKPPGNKPFVVVLDNLNKTKGDVLKKSIEPPLEPHPRALDVHGLFSTEPDMHGGFTDVSRFVRGDDPDADLNVFWRDWTGGAPPEGGDLDGPVLDPQEECCAVAVHRLKTVLKARNAKAWIWNDKGDRWESYALNDLTPGIVVMLHAEVCGYSAKLGWTGDGRDRLSDLPPPGPGQALQRDERVQVGCWASINTHLQDARGEAERICDGVGLEGAYRTAVVEGAALHDLGKLHPDWQAALPAGSVIGAGPWAKAPHVLRVEPANLSCECITVIEQALPGPLALDPKVAPDGQPVGLRWAVNQRVTRAERDQLCRIDGVKKAVHEQLRSGLRHEAASALALWRRYRDGQVGYSTLAAYLTAAHHGKVRTVLRSIKDEGDDVFGVRPDSAALAFNGESWPLDFGVAQDGAEGEWTEEGFVLTGHGWTGLVADLLGPWRDKSENPSGLTVVPEHEPHHLGPFVLAWLEALVRIADWRASDDPSNSIKPSQTSESSGSAKPSEVSDGG